MSTKSKNQFRIFSKPPLMKDVLLLEGYTRAGKFFTGRIINGFERVEHFQYVGIIDTIAQQEMIGQLPYDVAKFMIQSTLDDYAYYMRIGRNLNFRFRDGSTLLKSFDMGRYIARAFDECKNENVLKEFQSDGRYCTFVVHDILPNVKLFFAAFEHLKVISVLRHPIDLIYSWSKRGWGQREGIDPLSMSACLIKGKDIVPWWVFNWSELYTKMSQIDRVIQAIKNFSVLKQKSYAVLSLVRKKKILILTYERLVEDTDAVISQISRFLKTKPMDCMPLILKREGCPREIFLEDRERKISEIKQKASSKMFDIMMDLARDYEKNSESCNWVQ